MPITYRIEVGAGLVHSRAWGPLTEAETRAHYEAMGADPAFRPDFQQLCDLSEVNDLQTSREFLSDLARDSIFDRGTKRALIAPTDLFYGLGRMLQTLSDLDGREVGVFRTPAEAEAWLGLESGASPGAPSESGRG